jgi:hypothetical protein
METLSQPSGRSEDKGGEQGNEMRSVRRMA